MASIDNISVEGFLNLFKSDFAPYLLPTYQEGKAYFIDDVVYLEPNFYISLSDGNTTPPTDTTNWALYNDSVDNYIQDSDIERAFAEAKINFKTIFWKDDKTAEMVFYYVAAHYLIIDITNRQNPFLMGYKGMTQSKSVGSVSESYAIPEWMLNNQILGPYAQTGYGRKYLSLIQPYLIGNIIHTPGRTTFG